MGIGEGFARGLQKPIILWLLSHKPRHGYEIMMEFNRLTGVKLKPGIVYPFLHKLEREGFVSGEWVRNGKRKVKHYSLTKNGEFLLQKVKGLFTKPIREFFLDFIEKNKK